MLPSSGTALAHASRMTEEILAGRIAILEAKMEKVGAFVADFDSTLELRFRAQAEMLDERFGEVNQRFAEVNRRFAEVNQNVAVVRGDIGALQRDMTIVREGIKIILQKLS